MGDKEFLNAHLDLSRGCFLVHEWKPVQFQTALDQSPNTLTADSPLAAMRYVFEADAIAWTVENKTTQTLPVQMIPSQAVEALSNGAQEFVIPPVCREWTTTSWFIGKAKMTVTGGTKLWGTQRQARLSDARRHRCPDLGGHSGPPSEARNSSDLGCPHRARDPGYRSASFARRPLVLT